MDVFPTFSDEEWTEKIRPQPQTIYSVLPNGGGFSAAPLEPAYFSMFLPGQEHCLRRNLHRKLLRDDR